MDKTWDEKPACPGEDEGQDYKEWNGDFVTAGGGDHVGWEFWNLL
jgi:hypothetical protein